MSSRATNFSVLPKSAKVFFGLAVAIVLSACSGGGSSDSNLKTGIFMQGTVSGLSYITETQSGLTDSRGTFKYKSGESISFFIGGTQLGATVAASEAIGPMDLVPGVTIPVAAKEVKKFLSIEGEPFGEDPSLDARYELMNILLFLYSVDNDKLASNGISIASSIHSLFENNHFNLKVTSNDFEQNQYLKRKLYESYTADAVDSARIIRHWKALDDFATLQGLTPQVMVQTSYYWDRNADGEWNIEEHYTFDERHFMSSYTNTSYIELYEFNDYGDWMLARGDDWHQWAVRDIHGKILEWHDDYDNGGLTDYLEVHQYDEFGNLTLISYDYENDGVVDDIESFAYDANSNLIRREIYRGADANPELIEIFEYDANDYLIFRSLDTNGDGNPERIDTYSYDANGNRTMYAYDSNGDGTPERILTNTYDDNGNKVSQTYDSDGDGNPEYIETYSYDAHGNQVMHSFDRGADGSADEIRASSYNDNGQILWFGWDRDGDGTFDYILNNTYDEDGNLILETYDSDGDGNPNQISTHSYDVNGNLLSRINDVDADGTPEQIYTYEYDSNNNLIRHTFDRYADGSLDRITTYERDEFGNETRRVEDSNADGIPNRIVVNEYQMVNFLGWSIYVNY